MFLCPHCLESSSLLSPLSLTFMASTSIYSTVTFFSLTLLPTPQYFKIQFPNSFSPSLLKISQIHITLFDVILFKHIFLSMTVYLLLYPQELEYEITKHKEHKNLLDGFYFRDNRWNIFKPQKRWKHFWSSLG